MRNLPPTLVIDLGSTNVAAIVVTDRGSSLVPDPASGESRWPAAIHWDGKRITAGSAAEQRRPTEPNGYAADIKRALVLDSPVTVGARRLRPAEQAAELLAAIRAQAQRDHGPINRAVLTVPASVTASDPRRSHLIGAAEAAGFTAAELLVEPGGAVWVPGSPLRIGDLVLVYDLGATFEAALIRVGDDLPEIIGTTSIVDWPDDPIPANPSAAALELTVASCRDLLARLAGGPDQVDWVLPVGGGARTPGLEAALDRGLGIAVAMVDEPELAVVRGAAHWLPRSGPRTVLARPSPDRMVPLVFTLPGGSAQLLRWLVEPTQAYDAGAAVARVRLASGAVWDLTTRTRGTLDEVLVAGGTTISTGDWLALVRPG